MTRDGFRRPAADARSDLMIDMLRSIGLSSCPSRRRARAVGSTRPARASRIAAFSTKDSGNVVAGCNFACAVAARPRSGRWSFVEARLLVYGRPRFRLVTVQGPVEADVAEIAIAQPVKHVQRSPTPAPGINQPDEPRPQGRRLNEFCCLFGIDQHGFAMWREVTNGRHLRCRSRGSRIDSVGAKCVGDQQALRPAGGSGLRVRWFPTLTATRSRRVNRSGLERL